MDSKEAKKRRREYFHILILSLAFLCLTWLEFKIIYIAEKLPFLYSIFFFGLVNFNIVLLLLLFYLIFRNVVKVFSERRGRKLGGSLKGKLMASFSLFATIPTTLMFLISVFYINNSFEKWFSIKMSGVLKDALEVNQDYIFTSKRKPYHFAHHIASQLKDISNNKILSLRLEEWRQHFDLDAVEFYPNEDPTKRVMVTGFKDPLVFFPNIPVGMLKRALHNHAEVSHVQAFQGGSLVRVVVPNEDSKMGGVIVVSSFIPLSLISKVDEISSTYEELRNINPLGYQLKSIYLVILGLMTLMILVCATWFGFYLARQLSVPLETLGQATMRVSMGHYDLVEVASGSWEINQLILNFNQMIQSLDRSKKEVLDANNHLRQTLDQIDEHNRYIEIVLSNVTTGVISVDRLGIITTINRHAGQLLQITPSQFIDKPVIELLNAEYLELFNELLRSMKNQKTSSIQKEIRIQVKEKSIPLLVTLSLLLDESGNELGKVLVFDDLTPIVNAQRAVAWTEVARRIAHEIKNPLTPIKLSAQRIQKKFGAQITDPIFTSCIDMIIRQTDDLKNLVNEFSNFARLPHALPVKSSLNAVVQDHLVLFHTAHTSVQFEFKADESLPQFMFDPGQIGRVIQNLLSNAVTALQGRPTPIVTIETRFDPGLAIASLSISDNGPGIPDLDQSKIFEPYYSTKPNGTGLGLAIVKRIVDDHNGFVRVFANQPSGVKMLVELPVIDGDTQDFILNNTNAGSTNTKS